MNIVKYKITAGKAPGYMMLIYQDNYFKSVLNEFKPPLKNKQLTFILSIIPNDMEFVDELFKQAKAYLTITKVAAIGAEPALQPASNEGAKDFPVNEKIAMWCNFYAETHKDELGQDIKYKTGPAEIGKLKQLVVTADELLLLFTVYFKSDEWWSKPKSVSNFINKYNEVRALAYAKPKEKTYPLPYDELFYLKADTMEKRAYHAYLKQNGYHFEVNPGRGGKWVNYTGTI